MSYELNDFETDVIERSKQVPVLVDFWAPWCGPCRTLGPMLEQMAERAEGRWELAKVNVDDDQELAMVFNVSSIPAVKLFVDGKVADEFVGMLPEPEIRRFLDRALPSPSASQLAEARQLIGDAAHAEAAKILEPILTGEPGNIEARVLLAQALLSSAPERLPALLEPVKSESPFADKAEALRTLGRLAQLTVQANRLPEAKVRETYLAGAAALRSGDFAAALEAFILVVERDKQYDDWGARDACKAIFQLLGPRHPLAERFFRAFSSALHS